MVTATGLNLQLFGDASLVVDGRPVAPADTVAYKGMMLSGVPNMALALGYTNASWTLKCDLVSAYVCRLLGHMETHGFDVVMPHPPDPAEARVPIIDFESGYVLRAAGDLPKQGVRAPWRLHQNYFKDVRAFRRAPLADEGIRFHARAPAPVAPAEWAAA